MTSGEYPQPSLARGNALEILRGPGSHEWFSQAVCRPLAKKIFYPEAGQHGGEARRVCARCPVAAQCLEFALAHDEQGIWGGTSDRERRALRRNAVRRI